MKGHGKLYLGGLLAIVAAWFGVKTMTTDPVTPQDLRYGYGFPITASRATARVNIRILPNCRLPESAWQDPAFLSTVGASDGTFPVHLWRIRSNVAEKIATWRVPAAPCVTTPRNVFFQAPLPAGFEGGDVAVLEYTPAMMLAPSEAPGVFLLPDASQINNASNDAVTLQSVRVSLAPEVRQ